VTFARRAEALAGNPDEAVGDLRDRLRHRDASTRQPDPRHQAADQHRDGPDGLADLKELWTEAKRARDGRSTS